MAAARYNEDLFDEIAWNEQFARDVYDAVEEVLQSGIAVLPGNDLWSNVKKPLEAIRNIRQDPRGVLLTRFIEHGLTQLTEAECRATGTKEATAKDETT